MFVFSANYNGMQYYPLPIQVWWHDDLVAVKKRIGEAMIVYLSHITGIDERETVRTAERYLDRIINRWDYVTERQQKCSKGRRFILALPSMSTIRECIGLMES